MVNRLGYEVELAKEGVAAVEVFCWARNSGVLFDVVILDLTIDVGMGGKEAIKRLRASDPSAKAIVSIDHSSDPVAADFRGFGFDGVLQKPYQMRDLAEALQQVMAE